MDFSGFIPLVIHLPLWICLLLPFAKLGDFSAIIFLKYIFSDILFLFSFLVSKDVNVRCPVIVLPVSEAQLIFKKSVFSLSSRLANLYYYVQDHWFFCPFILLLRSSIGFSVLFGFGFYYRIFHFYNILCVLFYICAFFAETL